MGIVVPFKNKGTKLNDWVVTVRYVNKQYGINKANKWLVQHVPDQFHYTIQKILLADKRGK